MKFGDVVTAVASLAVIAVLVSFPLSMVLIPALGFSWGQNISAIVSFLLSGLIGGYIFAEKIWEGRMEAIAKITVLSTVLMIFSALIGAAVFADWTQMAKDTYLEANPTATLSTTEWYVVVSQMTSQVVFINVIMVLALGFIGLYVGSALRR